MIFRALPFHSSDRKQTFKLIKDSEPELNEEVWKNISPECQDLLLKMLIKDPKKRITVDEALGHPAFVKYGGPKQLSNKLRE